MPSVLFINRVYPPDSGATGHILAQVASALANAGWEVTVLATAGDGCPGGSELHHGVQVLRVGTLFSKASLAARAAGYALMIPSLLIKALTLPRADAVVTMTDPPMLAVLGPVMRLLKGSVLIHWAQDLYPEVAEAAGVVRRGGPLAGAIRAISTLSLRSHDLVVAVGRCMADRLSQRGIASDRVRVIPNIGMERGILHCESTRNGFRSRYGIPSDLTVVMYSGNLGRAHEFDTALDAARLLKHEGNTGILFLFVGGGAARPDVEKAAMDLPNVRFLPSQPGELVSESLGAADLHLVTMKREMSGLVVPSKFYGVLAARRPCIFVGPLDSEVARVIKEVCCGKISEPGEGSRLAEILLQYRNEPWRIAEEGERGLEWLRNQPDAGARLLHALGDQKDLAKK